MVCGCTGRLDEPKRRVEARIIRGIATMNLTQWSREWEGRKGEWEKEGDEKRGGGRHTRGKLIQKNDTCTIRFMYIASYIIFKRGIYFLITESRCCRRYYFRSLILYYFLLTIDMNS